MQLLLIHQTIWKASKYFVSMQPALSSTLNSWIQEMLC